jgi:hypothetical protein
MWWEGKCGGERRRRGGMVVESCRIATMRSVFSFLFYYNGWERAYKMQLLGCFMAYHRQCPGGRTLYTQHYRMR